VVEQNGQRLHVMKGAVANHRRGLRTPAPDSRGVGGARQRIGREGLSDAAVARGPETGAPTLLGLVSLYDPPRPDAKQLIAELQAWAFR